jgi:hypothetical protein
MTGPLLFEIESQKMKKRGEEWNSALGSQADLIFDSKTSFNPSLP